MANNKGKKYVKLTGNEIATPAAQARANAFLQWYATSDMRQFIKPHLYNDEMATDTMLSIYNAIAFKGLECRDPKFYFLRAYHTNCVAAKKNARYDTVGLEETGALAAPDFDYESYERAVDKLKSEIMEYVRTNYDAAECSIFEIYVTLLPDVSYKRLAKMLGFPAHHIWPVIKAIKNDVAAVFAERRDFLLLSVS